MKDAEEDDNETRIKDSHEYHEALSAEQILTMSDLTENPKSFSSYNKSQQSPNITEVLTLPDLPELNNSIRNNLGNMARNVSVDCVLTESNSSAKKNRLNTTESFMTSHESTISPMNTDRVNVDQLSTSSELSENVSRDKGHESPEKDSRRLVQCIQIELM